MVGARLSPPSILISASFLTQCIFHSLPDDCGSTSSSMATRRLKAIVNLATVIERLSWPSKYGDLIIIGSSRHKQKQAKGSAYPGNVAQSILRDWACLQFGILRYNHSNIWSPCRQWKGITNWSESVQALSSWEAHTLLCVIFGNLEMNANVDVGFLRY